MVAKSDFTDDEWHKVLRSPMMASLAVTVAEPSGLFGLIREGIAASGPLREAMRSETEPSLIKAMVEDFKTAHGRSVAQDAVKEQLKGKKPAEARDAAISALAEVTALVDAKDPTEAKVFKQWLKGTAEKVAEAASEGGFLGFGGEQVSEAERATLADIDRALGLT